MEFTRDVGPAVIREYAMENKQKPKAEKPVKTDSKYAPVSKKTKLNTSNVKKVTGGVKDSGGGWDLNHNEIFV
jgi:hypothetical protein